jgi:hypothetical protein
VGIKAGLLIWIRIGNMDPYPMARKSVGWFDPDPAFCVIFSLEVCFSSSDTDPGHFGTDP